MEAEGCQDVWLISQKGTADEILYRPNISSYSSLIKLKTKPLHTQKYNMCSYSNPLKCNGTKRNYFICYKPPKVLFAGALGNAEYPLLQLVPGLLWPGMVEPDSLIYGLYRTKLCAYAKLNCLE